jgi:hypothetical protein
MTNEELKLPTPRLITTQRDLAHTKVPLYDGDQMQEYAEAVATKWVMRAGAQEAMAGHYRAALEAIALHDYGRLHPAFDPQREALKALKKAGVLGPNVRAERPQTAAPQPE